MAEELVLGLFTDVTAAAQGIGQLRRLGLSDDQVTVMSLVPYEPQMLGRPRPRGGMMPRIFLGGLLGIALALFLTVGVFLLYPLDQGGQPLIPVPPTLIIIAEVALLGIMWAAFFGWLELNRMPAFGRPAYSVRISAGEIGVLARVEHVAAAAAAAALGDSGAREVQHLPNGRRTHQAEWLISVGAALVVGAVLITILMLFTYNVLRVSIAGEMFNQPSIAYVQGPRLAAPAAAVPIQGPVLISGQPASEPLSASAASLQRGQVLFGTNCALCHGQGGKGDGPLAGYFHTGSVAGPADLTGPAVQQLSDDELFLVITQGFGLMPSLAENLDATERWDVINYVRSLSK